MTAPAPERANPGEPWLVDAAIYVHAAYHAERSDSRRDGILAMEDPPPSTTGLRLASMVRDLLDRWGPDTGIACWNARGPQWRRELAPAYKANRKELSPGLRELLEQAPAILEGLGLRSVSVPTQEADDVIASACHRHRGCVIVSNDKDFYQLLGVNGTRIFDPLKRRAATTSPVEGVLGLEQLAPAGTWITLEDVRAKFGHGPERVVDVQALMGDSSDGVPGAYGVGPKAAADLIAHFGDLEACLAAPYGSVSGKLGSAVDKVARCRDSVRLSRRLVALVTDLDVPVYPITRPAAREGVGRFFSSHAQELAPVNPSPFAAILGAPTAPPPAPAPAPTPAPTLRDRLNAEAAAAVGAPPPTPAPAAPTRTMADLHQAITTAAGEYVAKGEDLAVAMEEIHAWAIKDPIHGRDVVSYDVARLITAAYDAFFAVAPPPPAPPVPASSPSSAPTAPAAPPAAAGPINPPDGVPPHLPATDYAPGGALDPNRKRTREGLEVPPNFGAWSGRTWTSIVKDEALNMRHELRAKLGTGLPREAKYRAHTLCPDKGAKRSDLLEDCKLLVAIMLDEELRPREASTEAPPPLLALEQAAPPAPPAPPGLDPHLPTDKALADETRAAVRQAAREAREAGLEYLTATGRTREINAARPDAGRLNRGEVDQITAGVYATKPAPVAPAPPPPAAAVELAPEAPAPPAPVVELAPEAPEPPAPTPPPARPPVEFGPPPRFPVAALYVDCFPMRSNDLEVVTLADLVEGQGWGRQVAEELRVAHYGIAPYNAGARGIAAHLDRYARAGELEASGVVVDTRTTYAGPCLEVLEALALVVVRRIF